jgi:hypothetical protein
MPCQDGLERGKERVVARREVVGSAKISVSVCERIKTERDGRSRRREDKEGRKEE